MTTVYTCSDLHIDHKSIPRFRDVPSVEENTRFIFEGWSSVVRKRDVVYVLGDVAFSVAGLEEMANLPGRKILVRGNHDKFQTTKYLQVFEEVLGFVSYKGKAWLSHCPMHPQELRGKVNVYGHVHLATIPDVRYYNVCMDNLIDWKPADLNQMIETPTKYLKEHGNVETA